MAGNGRKDGTQEDRLSRGTLLAYGAFALPLAALNLPLYVYLPTFYSAEVGLDLATIGLVLLAARLFDVVIDPVMGELGDRWRTPWGHRRPWLVLGAPLLLIASWQLFLPPAGADSLHLLVWSCAGYLAWTVIQLAYGAWGAELSSAYHERLRVTGMREAFVMLGILLAAGLPAGLGLRPEGGEALATLFWLMAALLPLTLASLLLLVREEPMAAQPELPFRRGLAIALANRPFRRLLLAFLLNGIANGLPATLFILFAEQVIRTGDSGIFLFVYVASGVLAIPGWLLLSRRLGKHRTWSLAMAWACLAFAAAPLLGPGDSLAFGLICLLSGLSLGADLALPAAMQADVLDLDRVQSGRRRSGLFFALWGMASKLALALAVGIAFPALSLLGFEAGRPNEGSALLGLVGLYAVLPILIKLVAIGLVWRFELDADRQKILREQIEMAREAVQ